jgi:hypothetical protein
VLLVVCVVTLAVLQMCHSLSHFLCCPVSHPAHHSVSHCCMISMPITCHILYNTM